MKFRWYQFSLRKLVRGYGDSMRRDWMDRQRDDLSPSRGPDYEETNGSRRICVPRLNLRGKTLGGRADSVVISNAPIADLELVSELKYLRDVEIEDSEINDITPLLKLNNLRWLVVRSKQISSEHQQQLRKAFPACEIIELTP